MPCLVLSSYGHAKNVECVGQRSNIVFRFKQKFDIPSNAVVKLNKDLLLTCFNRDTAV